MNLKFIFKFCFECDDFLGHLNYLFILETGCMTQNTLLNFKMRL